MRRFWLDCREIIATPGVAAAPLGCGLVAAVGAHAGLPLDILTAVVTAVGGMVVVVLTIAVISRIPWVRQRRRARGCTRCMPDSAVIGRHSR